jgi:hypothetical protein
MQPTYTNFEATVVVGKVTPTTRNELVEPVVQVKARAVPLSLNLNIIRWPSAGEAFASALIVKAFAKAVIAYSSKDVLFQAKGDVTLAALLTLGLMLVVMFTRPTPFGVKVMSMSLLPPLTPKTTGFPV